MISKIKNRVKFYLASRSPRRAELLSQIGIPFEIINFKDEDYETPDFESCDNPGEYVISKAKEKLNYIFIKNLKLPSIIISSDTIVWQDNRVFGKPHNKENAIKMISTLSGKTHQVYSGLALKKLPEENILTGFEKTDVTFRKIENEEIIRYVSTGEPLDKAGGYALQGLASIFIESICGDYTNVIGLPLFLLSKLLDNEIGISVLDFWGEF